MQSYVSDGKSRFGKRKSELYQPTVQTSAFFKDLASFSTGVTAVYRETPTINVAPTIASESITYGGQFDNAHDVTGFVGADTSATILRGTIEPSLNTTLSNSGNYNVGTYTLRYDNFTLTYKGLSNPYGYNIAYSTGTRTVDPKPLTVIYSASDRNYNGNKQAAVTPQISGNLIGDLVGLTQTAEFASENVQYVNGSVVDQAVSISITGKTGADSGNYSISTNEYSVLAKILPKTATLSGSRAYDGTDIIVSSDLTVSTGIADETLQLTGSATVNSKDVNDATHLSDVNSLTLQNSNNGLAGNYTLIADVGSSPFSIVKKKVQLTAEKVYDGKRSLDAAHFGNSLNTGVDGETLTLTGVAQANNAHVINAENIGSWDTLALGDGDGGLAANYALPAEGDVIVSVLPFELTLEPGSSVTKVYDGTNGSANLPMSFKLENWENKGLGINYDYSGGTFNSADVANANAFTYVTPSLTGIVDGNTSGNFDDGIGLISDFSISSSSSSAEVPGTITAYMLTANEMKFEVLGAVDASTSVYASNAVIFGLGGEVLTLDLDSGTSISHTNNASNARVAEGQNFNNVSLLKDDVQNLNYLLDTSNASPYQITAKKVVLSVVNGLNTFEKVYDGNNTALDFYSADDEDSSNNSIPSFWSLKDEDGVTYEHNFNGKKLYDIKSFGPLVVNRLLTFDAEFESKDAGDVSILITNVAFNDEYGLSDSFKSSYTFEPVNRINAKITPKPLSYIPINALDGNPVTFNNRLKKYYDGTADVSEALQFQLSSGIISGDVVSIDPPLEIEARDVDSNQLIVNRTAYRRMVSPVLSLSGEDASNYSVTVGADFKYGIPMDILPKILTLSATKTLDYTADFQLEAITLGGVVSGEAIELSKASYTKSGIQSSVLGQFLLKENTGLPDPNNQEQIDWFVEKTGTDSSEAANWLQGMKDQYDNAVDIAPLEIPFLSVTSNVDSEFTEVVDVGSHNLAIKMLPVNLC